MIHGNQMFHGMSIYVCSEALSFFVVRILPRLQHRFTLVTGDSDLSIPKEAIGSGHFARLIHHPLLIRWFAQNVNFPKSEKIILLPIGLDYHTIAKNVSHPWKTQGEGHSPIEQESIIKQLRSSMKPFYERKRKIIAQFSLHNDRFDHRKEIGLKVSKDLVVSLGITKRTAMWNHIMQYAFVFSPFGNGMDCHRTWETLCLGAIPIIKRHPSDFMSLFCDLPVWIVEDWGDITEESMTRILDDFEKKQRDGLFRYEKLNLSYWIQQIYENLK